MAAVAGLIAVQQLAEFLLAGPAAEMARLRAWVAAEGVDVVLRTLRRSCGSAAYRTAIPGMGMGRIPRATR